jgi:hypothetical protein
MGLVGDDVVLVGGGVVVDVSLGAVAQAALVGAETPAVLNERMR